MLTKNANSYIITHRHTFQANLLDLMRIYARMERSNNMNTDKKPIGYITLLNNTEKAIYHLDDFFRTAFIL